MFGLRWAENAVTQTRTARAESKRVRMGFKTLNFCGKLQSFDNDIFIPGFGFAAAVDLEADDAVVRNVWICLGVIDGFYAVDPKLNVLTFATDFVVVPIVAVQDFVYLFHV